MIENLRYRCPIWSRGAEDTSLEHLLPKADLYDISVGLFVEKCRVMVHLYTGYTVWKVPNFRIQQFLLQVLWTWQTREKMWKDSQINQ